jgi:hypothetical protein
MGVRLVTYRIAPIRTFFLTLKTPKARHGGSDLEYFGVAAWSVQGKEERAMGASWGISR